MENAEVEREHEEHKGVEANPEPVGIDHFVCW
jgi:hypothetical protein